VALDGLVGTGPHGRVTTADVLRVEASTSLSRNETDSVQTGGSSPVTRPRQSTAVIEVDVTRMVKGAHPLLAAVIEAAVLALRQALPDGPGTGIRVVADVGGRARTIHDADRLSLAGLLRALEGAPVEPRAPLEVGAGRGAQPEDRTLVVHDAGGDGFLFESVPMAVGDLAALSVGAAVERAAVVLQTDGERGIGVRTCVHLALTYDDQLSRAGAATMLAAVRARLEETSRSVGGESS
jgi:hypothetical protein